MTTNEHDAKQASESEALTAAYMMGVADEREKHRADDALINDLATALEYAQKTLSEEGLFVELVDDVLTRIRERKAGK